MQQLNAALEPFFRHRVPCSQRVDALLRLVVDALLRHDVLRRLLAVQQLDTLDVEGAYQASHLRSYCWLCGALMTIRARACARAGVRRAAEAC